MVIPHHSCNLAEGETFPVKVFREHQLWGTTDKWWQMPIHLLKELFVCEYECDCQGHVEWIRQQHPNDVLVYCFAKEFVL